MAIRNTFVAVSDGDQLNEGYFNGIYNTVDETPKWNFIETLSLSAGTTVTTTGTITVYDEYLVVIESLVGSSNNDLRLRINGDTGTNYDFLRFDVGGNTILPAIAYIILCGLSTTNKTTGSFVISGKTAAVASGELSIVNNIAGALRVNEVYGIAAWAGGNATQVTDFTLFNNSGNSTGTFHVYGRTF